MIEAISSWDRSLFLFINSLHHESLNGIMHFLSGQALWIPFILLIVYLAFRELGKKTGALFFLFLVLALIASDVSSSYLLKNIFLRYRPCRLEDLKPLIYMFGQKCGGKFGFVSSHAANSFLIVIFSLRILKRKWLHLMWILPVLVSYSRIYLGVHYPGDIIGGLMVGAIWGTLLSSLFKRTTVLS